jgi:hypothetical protein
LPVSLSGPRRQAPNIGLSRRIRAGERQVASDYLPAAQVEQMRADAAQNSEGYK